MTRKKRILWVNEAHFLATGYSNYGLEVLKRLYATGKYELYELGCYGPWGDERAQECPWNYRTAMPNPADQGEVDRYNSNPINQFGEWKFEEACLWAKPDVVMDVRDWWNFEYQERSPFRSYFHWAIAPACDAQPQDEQWVSTFLNADAVFTYSDWALEVLRKEGGGNIKLKCSASPGADLNTFKPKEDRRAHRRDMGVDEDCFIVGTCNRNQSRKLFPDLCVAFADFLKKAPATLAKKTFLYLHTSWPDVGWDIPRLLVESGIASRVVCTYMCKECGAVFPSFFQDARTVCRRCHRQSAVFPNAHMGVSREVLASVMNTFDCYVQYANSEGFGMGAVEAAACGVPVFEVDYSAMSDVVRKLKGFPIKVQRLYRESATHCWRALPDNDDFVAQLIKYLSQPQAVRDRKRYETRKAVEEHYTYEKTAKIWEDHLDSVEAKDSWGTQPQLHQPVMNVPQGLSNEELVRWGLTHVAGRPELLNSYMAMRMVRDLNWECSLPQMGGIYFNEASTLGTQNKFQTFNRDMALQSMLQLCEQKNHWERKRCGLS